MTTWSGDRGLEKIKTIGDAYMVAGGVPGARADHADSVTGLAVEMLDYVAGLGREDLAVGLRIGIHSGRVVAGVIGKHKFSYDIWGDTVNTAARLRTSSEPGRIQISAETARRLGPGWRARAARRYRAQGARRGCDLLRPRQRRGAMRKLGKIKSLSGVAANSHRRAGQLAFLRPRNMERLSTAICPPMAIPRAWP